MNVVAPVLKRECCSGAEVRCRLCGVLNVRIELDNISDMKTGQRRSECKKDVVAAGDIARGTTLVELLNSRAHTKRPNETQDQRPHELQVAR